MLGALLLLVSCGDAPPYGSDVSPVQIPPDMRAVTVLIHQDISVVPGDRVDLLFVGKGQETNAVLENVEVAVADKEVGIVTFLVSPDEAQKMQKIMAASEVTVTLRSRQNSN